ncbi:MAG TPA: class I SAM-dependent methyltransferase [Nitrospira sp.]|nr:class I SAM-dependent methyltransferase [Nitrospira sp.]
MPASIEMTTDLFSGEILRRLKPPGGRDDDDLEPCPEGLRCLRTGEVFPLVSGIPSLFRPSPGDQAGVTTTVRSFYEANPFPSYEGVEEFGELVSKGMQSSFARRLLEAIGYNKTILECGCGTGQMTHFLQLNNNHVLGIDLSLSSLALAMEHKRRNRLARSSFAQMNIFDLAIKDASFDVVLSHGVLHHTYDARLAFSRIARKVRPGGIVVVGLYNSFARVPTWIRAKLIGLFGPRLDYVVRHKIRDPRKADIWVKDQYYNPHETWHSIDDVLGWFEENDIDYLNTNPPILGTEGNELSNLFAPTSPGTKPGRILTQLSWLRTIAREGALFDLVGRRRSPARPLASRGNK